MRRIWFTGALALGDHNVASERGFLDAVEQDCEIVDRWREIIRPDSGHRDVVWILGDPLASGADEVAHAQLDELTGLRHVVLDRLSIAPGVPHLPLALMVRPPAEALVAQRSVNDADGKAAPRANSGTWLPRRWALHADRAWALDRVDRERRTINVGAELWNYEPVALDTVRSIITEENP